MSTRRSVAGLGAAILCATAGTGSCSGTAYIANGPEPVDAKAVRIEAPKDAERPPYRFTPEQERLLDEVQRGAFNFLWNAIEPKTGMVRDRTSKHIVSVAGVGFQLAALPIGVERGWVSRDQAAARADLILRSLSSNPENRKAGLFYHFLNGNDAGQPAEAYEHVVSTIDSALLFAGILTAGEYFGGSIRERGDALFEAADWSFFVSRPGKPFTGRVRSYEMGFISLAWKPNDQARPTGDGKLVPYFWLDAGDEQKLTVLLAVSAPQPDHAVPPAMYYSLRRQLGSWNGVGPMAWFPFSGALFTNFFAHCYLNYGAIGPDEPARFTDRPRASIDWWENSRRMVRMHQNKTRARTDLFPILGDAAWGLTASDVSDGYAVPGLFPDRIPVIGEIDGPDYSSFAAKDDFGDGTIAPYGAGSAIIFDPEASVRALRRFRELNAPDGKPMAWADPDAGGFGFFDAFNAKTGWVATDCLAIDQGPLLLCIENARTGLVWKLFASHTAIQAGLDKLGLKTPVQKKTGDSKIK